MKRIVAISKWKCPLSSLESVLNDPIAGGACPISTRASPSRSRAWPRPPRRRPPRRSPSRRTPSTSGGACWRRGPAGAPPAARWPPRTSPRSWPPTTPCWRRTTRRARTRRSAARRAGARRRSRRPGSARTPSSWRGTARLDLLGPSP
jgi:hypothetical protein